MEVITVGRLTAQKNPFRLLEIARLSRKANLNIHYTWLGDGDMKQVVKDKIAEMNLEDTVEILGYVKNPYPYIKKSDLMLVTSDYEGFCLVICEAMCLGVPVISTRTAGPEEIIGKNEYGILTDLSAEAMFEALKRLADNPKERSSLAQKAFSRPDRFSVEQTLQGIYDLI